MTIENNEIILSDNDVILEPHEIEILKKACINDNSKALSNTIDFLRYSNSKINLLKEAHYESQEV